TSLKALTRSETTSLLLLINYWGSLNPVGEGTRAHLFPAETFRHTPVSNPPFTSLPSFIIVML
ncbi:hypothetical protein ACS6JK_20860, partial [Enterobacter chuandaensis]|uniref:hypothetical protein n=1 Tax=Enterobacter chuandaensis TaxID=2497875 RepID=UPI003F42A397